MAIQLGSSTPTKLFLGSSAVQYLYMGKNQVWTVGITVPSESFGSVFNFRALASLKSFGSESIDVFGDLFSYQGSTTFRTARLAYNGTGNTTYATNVSASLVHTFSANGIYNARQDSSGATFVSSDAGTPNRFVKLNINGTKDTSFNVGTGLSGNSLMQPDFLFTGSSVVVTEP